MTLVSLEEIQNRKAAVSKLIEKSIDCTPVDDIHTHIYDPVFGDLLLWGIDELLVYHYLVAEGFRWFDIAYDDFWTLPKSRQADMIWEALFIKHSPVSEACRGVITTLNSLGLDVNKRDLPGLRKWFADWKVEDYIDKVFETAGVRSVCMTNSPFDEQERPIWEKGFKRDERFKSALRIDPLVLDWPHTAATLKQWGYEVGPDISQQTADEIRRFLADWTRKMNAGFVMVSFPPTFEYPSNDTTSAIIEKAIVPHCKEFNMPFSLMPGVKRQVNPLLRLAGDGVGLSNLKSLQNLCAAHPDAKFTATVLARENQHELAVLTRKFRNLHIFGCWWFTNIPLLIEEMTQMRVQLLGLSFTPQHSDARVLDQLIYKWKHSRHVIKAVLKEEYGRLVESGWNPTPEEIERDVKGLFGGAYYEFEARKAAV